MKKIAVASSILALVAGAASAERPIPQVPPTANGQAIQVQAGSIYSNKDLHRNCLTGSGLSVTIADVYPAS